MNCEQTRTTFGMTVAEMHREIWGRVVERIREQGLHAKGIDDGPTEESSITKYKREAVCDMVKECKITAIEAAQLFGFSCCVLCVCNASCMDCPLYKATDMNCGSSYSPYLLLFNARADDPVAEAIRIRDVPLDPKYDEILEKVLIRKANDVRQELMSTPRGEQ